MTETVAVYDVSNGRLAGIPNELWPTLRLIELDSDSKIGSEMIQFVASFVHPDFSCNLAVFSSSECRLDVRTACAGFIVYCLGVGLSPEEQSAILVWLRPYLGIPIN